MKLVLIYGVSDDCTYSFDVTLPVEADSKEQVYCLLKDETEKARLERKYEVTLFGHKFDPSNFWYQERLCKRDHKGRYQEVWTENMLFSEPEILTIEEWFQQHGGQE